MMELTIVFWPSVRASPISVMQIFSSTTFNLNFLVSIVWKGVVTANSVYTDAWVRITIDIDDVGLAF